MSQRFIASSSGGKDSTAMALRLMLVVFILVCFAVAVAANTVDHNTVCNVWCAGPPSEAAFIQCIEGCREVLP